MLTIEKNSIVIHQFTWDYIDSNAYVIKEDGSALIVDPIDSEEFMGAISDTGIKKASVLLTHEHFDHISGLNKLRDCVDCTVYAQSICSRNLGDINRNLSKLANVIIQFGENPPEKLVAPFVCSPADVVFNDRLKFQWNGHSISLNHTPGHSPGSMCAIVDGTLLFSGDTLLSIPSITRFPGGNTRDYREITIPWFENLEGIRYDFPGHGNSGHFIEMMWLNRML